MSNMPKVSLIWFTGKGTKDETYGAARLLAYTKNTRLQMTPDGYERFENMPVDELEKELLYMSNTIPSSWEFVDVIFAVHALSKSLVRAQRALQCRASASLT